MRHITRFHQCITTCMMLLLCNSIHAESIPNVISEEKYDSIAAKFYASEMVCVYDSIAEQKIHNHTPFGLRSYTQDHVYSINGSNNTQAEIQKALIIVKDNIFSALPLLVIRYAHDIHNAFGCAVDIVAVDGETPPQIRSLIQSYSTNLNAVVLIGDIAAAIYHHPAMTTGQTNWDEDYFPCDLFYMDLNGTWNLESGGDGCYDNHTGTVEPEIFVGRINTSTMGRNEILEMKNFLDKDHQYWTGQKALNKQRALTFTGPDWNNSDFWYSVEPLYGSNYYDVVMANMFNKANYLSYLQNSNYEFIQLACHSTYGHHEFGSGSSNYLYNSTISSTPTKQIGYNLFCCHACNWISSSYGQCLGESYLYGSNNNSAALAIVGSTKTGGMLGFSSFYTYLGVGACIGSALKVWWLIHCGMAHTTLEKLWFYGMTILGDPFINFNFTNECDNLLVLNEGEEPNVAGMYYAQEEILVQNYSITQGQTISLSAPTIYISGPFLCNTSSTFLAKTSDSCVCNDFRNSHKNDNTDVIKKSNTRMHESSASEFCIYPNPSVDVIVIDTNESPKLVSIYNQRGQCVLQTKETHISVSHLSAGIYIVQCMMENGEVLITKIIHK